MTLPSGLDRTFSVLSSRKINRKAARVAMRLVCFAVLAVACRTAKANPLLAHVGGVIPVGSGFSLPQGVAVDRNGNVFVADNHAVKEIVAVGGVVTSSSTVRTINSTFTTPTGIAVDGNGNVFVTDPGTSLVYEIVAVDGAVVPGTNATRINSGAIIQPTGIAVDGSGNVFVTDQVNNAVFEIVAVDGAVVPGTNPTQLSGSIYDPSSVTVDGNGNVFVMDSNAVVKEFTKASNYTIVNTIASGFSYRSGVAVDGSGNVFVADHAGGVVKEIVAVNGIVSSSSMVTTIANGFNNPYGVAVDGSGNVFVGDAGNSAVKEIVLAAQKLSTTAVGSTSVSLPIFFTFDSGGSIGAPVVLTQGAAGLDFADAGTGTCSTTGTYSAGDTCTVDVKFTPKYPGQRLGAVQLMTTGGAVIATANIYGTGTGPLVTFPSNTTVKTIGSGFLGPYGVAVDGSGNVFVADLGHSAVKELMAVGGVVSSNSTVNAVGSGFNEPTAVAVDGSGNVFVTDTQNNAVKEIVAVGGVVSSSSTVKTIGSGFFVPFGVAVDGSGNVFVADRGNSEVKEIMAVGGAVSSSSTVNTVGSGFSAPTFVAVDGSGNVFVGDGAHSVVKEIVAVGGAVSSNSAVNTIGSGVIIPYGVAVDGSGNVFVTDLGNNTMKEIDLSDPPSLSFPTATNAGSTDTTDGPLTVTVANSGNAALNFTVPASGSNPSVSADFTLDSTGSGTCPLTTGTPNTLAAGASCTLPVSFAPTAGGMIGGSLVLTDTHLNANPSTTQTISLNGTGLLLTPTLGFATIPAHTYGDTPFIVTATSLSPGAVTYAVASGPATISGSTVTLIGGGTVNLSASQAATTTYAAATATTSFVVGPATPTLIFATTPHIYGDAPFSVSATSASSGAVTYTVLSGPAMISGDTVTLTGAGTVVLSASQAATASYTAAAATASFTVDQTPSTLTFATIPAHIYGDAPFSVSATSASSGAVTYAVLSGPATISGNTVTLTGAGTVNLSASQAATPTYAAATATTSFVVGQIPSTLTFAAIPAHIYGDAPFSVSATSASSGAVSYAVVSGPATISGSTVTLTGAGTVVLSASQAATANFASATATASFTVGQAPVSDFSVGTTGTSSQSIAAGGTATFSFSLAPTGGAYPGAVSFTATGLPTGATATFSPASIAANGGAQTVILTVKTSTSAQAKLDMPVSHRGGLIAFALLFLPLAGTRRMRRVARKLGRGTGVALLLLLSLGTVVGLSGCGGDSSPSSPTAKSYTIAVTAISGSAQHTTNFTLQVQ